MSNIEPLPPIRERIRELNTKSYYLLAALSFVYRVGSESYLLKWALTLAAAAAVLPVLDYVQSRTSLEVIRASKVICMVLALVFLICWIWTAPTTQALH